VVRSRSVWLLIAVWSAPALLMAMQAWLDPDIKDVGPAVIRELHHGAGELVVVLHSGARLPVSRRRREAVERLFGTPG
jgi:hypothetical protein